MHLNKLLCLSIEESQKGTTNVGLEMERWDPVVPFIQALTRTLKCDPNRSLCLLQYVQQNKLTFGVIHPVKNQVNQKSLAQ